MPPRRRHGKPVTSPRYLVLRHARSLIQARAQAAAGETPPEKLAPGFEQLFSSYVPGLRAGQYKVEVKQNIKVIQESEPKLTGPTSHIFDVLAPRFVLPPDCVYSTFPVPSGSAPVETLAHVVLNDTTLPWERGFDTTSNREISDENRVRNRIPWLACLTFEADELRLTDQQLNGSADRKSIFAGTSHFPIGIKQSPTLAVQLDISDFVNLDTSQVTTPYKTIDGESQPGGELIFSKPDLFNHLFSDLDDRGVPLPDRKFCSVSRYKYLAHMRRVNTHGMAEAGKDDEATDREFSIVVSHRTGPPGQSRPTSLVSHLVSIEGIEQMPYPVDLSKLVALPSLYSWTHTCLPAGSFKIQDAFEHLGRTESMLRTPDDLIFKMGSSTPPAIMAEATNRIQDGFSLLRWRTIRGDATVALSRGPFVPKSFPDPPRETFSNSGQSLQILDQKLGIMDLSYSTAWHLGRTLALADPSFTAALCRVRKEILQQANDKARRAVYYQMSTSVMEVRHLLGRLERLVSHLAKVPIEVGSEQVPIDLTQRWRRDSRPQVDITYQRTAAGNLLEAELRHAAFRISSSVDPASPRTRDDQDPHYDPAYDEHNTPASADWMLVLKFVLDLLYLIKVPMHYLVTDVSHLPSESLRFFHIDPNWTEALVDGALSLGNYVDRGKDQVRKAMKDAIKRYRDHVNPEVGYQPPVPTYGFLLRSAVVREFPDLVVSTEPVVNSDRAPLIARQEVLDADLLLVLMTKVPGIAELEFLTLSQPAHQQCFTAAKSLTKTEITLAYKRIYTEAECKHKDPNMSYPFDQVPWKRTENDELKRPYPYIWGATLDKEDLRILNVEHLAQHLYTTLGKELNNATHTWFNEISPTAAMLGVQLNDPCWQLRIKWPTAKPNPPPCPPSNYPAREIAVPVHRKILPTQDVHHFSFAERQALPLLYLEGPPPHCGNLWSGNARLNRNKWPVMKPRDDGGSASPPEYEYKVYPVTNPGQEGVRMLLEAQDLVFSIVYKAHAIDYKLQQAVIDIPVGNDNKFCLTKNYLGSGTFMLSNLRMNVLPTYSSDEKVLRIVLKPRSHFGYVEVVNLVEMSFMLSGVHVSRAYDTDVDVECPVTLEYFQQIDKQIIKITLVNAKQKSGDILDQ
ncbi:hypothetical protein MMC14_008464 [Varicellaria rhodocarpa]|nr:hypothetical protein [Varicellaria rhodocarpa]